MSLSAGSRIGAYEILGSLGAGGMGEVYRARDARLNRDVAIKVLPDALAGNSDRLSRLHREAQVLASLNHPNIAIVHGFEESPSTSSGQAGGVHALVMELVEGPTLADRITEASRLDIDEAMAIARQIADALDAAHEHGVVHRDLKPANIKLRPDGTVKVLDFGLAKIMDRPAKAGHYEGTGDRSGRQPDLAVSQSPTLISPAMMTGVGMIFGTAAYMSPEQARGKTVDKRADIWAFGCVLYEMLTGTRAFGGGNEMSDTLAAVLKDEPDWTRVPPRARALLQRCLEKDPKRRLRDIGDAMALLAGGAQTAAPAPRRLLWTLAAIACVSLVFGGALAFVHFGERTTSPRAVHFVVPPPARGSFGPTFALSPDGRMVAYIGVTDGASFLWVHSFDTGKSRPLTAAGSFSNAMFWSPDSRFIAYAIEGRLKKVSVNGDQVQTICDLPSSGGFGGGSWGRDNVILFGGNSHPVMSVSADGGTVRAVTSLRGEVGDVGPTFLPDGRHFLYSRITGRPENRGILLGSLDVAPESQSTTRLLASDSRPVFSNGGAARASYVMFLRDGTLLAQLFDLDRLTTSGDAFPIAEQIGTELTTAPLVSAADDGTVAFRSDTGSVGAPIWANRAGVEVGAVSGDIKNPQFPRLSPDGTRLALVVDNELWEYDLQGRPPVKLTTEGNVFSPMWTPDGKSLIYESNNAPALRMVAAVPGASSRPASPEGHFHPHGWSPDGKELIAVQFTGGDSGTDVVRFVPDATAKPQFIVRTPAREGVEGATLSPDGRWLAYVSNATGDFEVWVQSFAREGNPVRVSPRGGVEPVWARDGRELFYLEGNKLMAVAVDGKTVFNFEPPTLLFEYRYRRSSQPPSYEVAADGRFLIIKQASVTQPPIEVITNWAQSVSRAN
jgi:Tol biopolymer transport system component